MYIWANQYSRYIYLQITKLKFCEKLKTRKLNPRICLKPLYKEGRTWRIRTVFGHQLISQSHFIHTLKCIIYFLINNIIRNIIITKLTLHFLSSSANHSSIICSKQSAHDFFGGFNLFSSFVGIRNWMPNRFHFDATFNKRLFNSLLTEKPKRN